MPAIFRRFNKTGKGICVRFVHQFRVVVYASMQYPYIHTPLFPQVYGTCSQQFWEFFLPLHTFSGVNIDICLRGAKKSFLTVRTDAWKSFPGCRRSLYNRIKNIPSFWPKVMHSERIDLSGFDLPSKQRQIIFNFIDPLWGWLVAARRQSPVDLHWKPIAQDPRRRVFGGGVEYGDCFRQACASCPAGTHPMCFALHWDGAIGRGLSVAPICIGVANTNVCDFDTQFCLGYMPHVSDNEQPEFRKTTLYTTVKHHIRNRCAAAILRVLEVASKTGMKCRLKNIRNQEVERLLFPRSVRCYTATAHTHNARMTHNPLCCTI